MSTSAVIVERTTMIVIQARNVHQAFAKTMNLLRTDGVFRQSRNGSVTMFKQPVVTQYEFPMERVIFWPQRDANPFFHIYESLWMLDGRNDVAGVARYAKQMAEYSDDGETLRGAYGHRWRKHFEFDQLEQIIAQLKANHNDRRAVLSMFDAKHDLGHNTKDIPCNISATFQIGVDGRLDMMVFNRSNDIIWGAYGANAVHFSVLQEYIALNVGVHVGRYWQVSANFHAYDNVFVGLNEKQPNSWPEGASPYQGGYATVIAMSDPKNLDTMISTLLNYADTGETKHIGAFIGNPWFNVMINLLQSHRIYKSVPGPERFDLALDPLRLFPNVDWVVAAREWINRRADAFHKKQAEAVTV